MMVVAREARLDHGAPSSNCTALEIRVRGVTHSHNASVLLVYKRVNDIRKRGTPLIISTSNTLERTRSVKFLDFEQWVSNSNI
jgi:hypothetical protein